MTPFGFIPSDPEGLWKAYLSQQFLKANPNWRPSVLYGIVFIGALDEMPELQRIHSASTYEADPLARILTYWRTRSTQEIIDSHKPGQPESLKTWPDGRMASGNTRTLVLEERGIPINSLPREVVERP